MADHRSSRWPFRVLAIAAILCGVLIALWSLGSIAFQAWLSATPDSTGREGAAAIRAALVGLGGLVLATLGAWILIRRKRSNVRGVDSHPPTNSP